MSSNNMMVRTTSGLFNQHLFFGTDLVVYCEGGPEHLSMNDAVRNGSDETGDAAYWRAVFAALRPEQKVHVKSVGSKSVAQQIAMAVARSRITTVSVCVDADFTHFAPITGPALPLISTWGYSWESDLCCPDVAAKVFFKLRRHSIKNAQIFEEYKTWSATFFADCERYIKDDYIRVTSGNPAVFDRTKILDSLNISSSSAPSLKVHQIEARKSAPTHPNSFPVPNIICTPIWSRHCFGKVLLKSVYHGMSFFAQRARRGKIDFDTFIDLCIDSFKDWLRQENEVRQYFDNALPT